MFMRGLFVFLKLTFFFLSQVRFIKSEASCHSSQDAASRKRRLENLVKVESFYHSFLGEIEQQLIEHWDIKFERPKF